MDSQPLCDFYESHILECRLVVCGMSFSWVSLIISQGYFSEFPRALPHVWSGWLPSWPSVWLLHVKRSPSCFLCWGLPLRSSQDSETKCPSGMWPLTPNPGGAHQRPGGSFWMKLHSKLEGNTSIAQRIMSKLLLKVSILRAHRWKHDLSALK